MLDVYLTVTDYKALGQHAYKVAYEYGDEDRVRQGNMQTIITALFEYPASEPHLYHRGVSSGPCSDDTYVIAEKDSPRPDTNLPAQGLSVEGKWVDNEFHTTEFLDSL